MIYLLEDDESIRKFVIYALNNSGMEALGFESPSLFWQAVKRKLPRLVLLDIMLPEESGLKVLEKIRNHMEINKIPVIMLTARGTEYDKVIGLDSGADDYVAKPFGAMELISRVKALLRRSSLENGQEEYNLSGLYFCPVKHLVKCNGQEVFLSYKEFELLRLLLSHIGEVFTRDQILQKIWGFEYDGETRTVDVHIKTLRTKLLECGKIIETVRGVGYKIVRKND